MSFNHTRWVNFAIGLITFFNICLAQVFGISKCLGNTPDPSLYLIIYFWLLKLGKNLIFYGNSV